MKDNKISKLLTILAAIIGIVGVIFYIMVVSAGDDAIKSDAELQRTIVSPYAWFTLIIIGLAIFAAVISSILNLFKKPEQLKKTLLSLGVLGIILLVSYLNANGDAVYDSQGVILKEGAAGATSKWVGTGISFSIVLGGLASLGFVVDLLRGLVKS